MLNLVLIVVIAILFILIIKSSLANSKKAKLNHHIQIDFLEENKQKEGIIQTDSGLQYMYLTRNDDGVPPTKKSKVLCHYHGTLINGDIFDSSVERNKPITFSLNQVIPGWTEVLQLMKSGEKVKAFIPYHLAYGKRAVGKIPPASLLIFEIELIEVTK